MYQTARKIHLWVGVILAIVILIEAVTGLILAEPWLIGEERGQGQQQRRQLGKQQIGIQANAPDNTNAIQGEQRAAAGRTTAPSSAFGLAKGLHQGKFETFNLKWLVSLSAIGLIILTLTGIYIAIPILKARYKGRTGR